MNKTQESELGGYNVFNKNFFALEDQLNLSSRKIKLFSLGRHCLKATIDSLKPDKIYIPFYTCKSIKDIAKKYKVSVDYYFLNNDLIPNVLKFDNNSLLVVNNYFGLASNSSKFSKWLSTQNKSNIIVDNTHSFGISNQFPGNNSFYSPRKFLPLTDGGILFDENNIIKNKFLPIKTDRSWNRTHWLFRSIDETTLNKSYLEYKTFRKNLQELEYLQMSKVTSFLLKIIDINSVIIQRNLIYSKLSGLLPMHDSFKRKFLQETNFSPIGYPLFVNDSLKVQKNLEKNNIYTIRFWPELHKFFKEGLIENSLINNLLIYPINKMPTEKQIKLTLECID